MKQIVLTPTRGTPDSVVRKVADWLTRKCAGGDLPFSVVQRDTDGNEQYGVLLHFHNQAERDAALKALAQLRDGAYPAHHLMKNHWMEVEHGTRLPETVGLRELPYGCTVGRVFE